jgi:hypothetical protein
MFLFLSDLQGVSELDRYFRHLTAVDRRVETQWLQLPFHGPFFIVQKRCKINFSVGSEEYSSLIQQLYLGLLPPVVGNGLRSAWNDELKYYSLIILCSQLERNTIQQAVQVIRRILLSYHSCSTLYHCSALQAPYPYSQSLWQLIP